MMLRRLAPLGLFLLAACGQSDLYSNVSEREANDMIVVLGEAGVEATKKPAQDGAFTVAAPSGDFGYAMEVLTAADFPRDQNDTMKELLKKKSLVSPESEQRMRATALLTEELNATLSQIDGVQVARVHIVTPAKNKFGELPAEPTASVFIKHRADTDFAEKITDVKKLVAYGVEGLSYERVEVALFQAPSVPVRAEPPVVEQAAAEFAAPALGGLGALALGLFGFRAVRRSKTQSAGEIEGPQVPDDD